MNSKWKRVALIGAGGIAKNFSKALAELPNVQLVAASARTPGKAAAFLADTHGAVPYTDTAQMLQVAKPDFAVDCSPSGNHLSNIQLCASLGVHILSEKPVVMNYQQLEQAVEAVVRGGIKAGGIFQHRFLPAYLSLRDAIKSGRFGMLSAVNICLPWYRKPEYYAQGEWRGKPESDGGAVMNQGSHEIDIALWLASASVNLAVGENPIAKLVAFTSNVAHQGLITVEDTASVSVQFRNGALGSWHFTTAANGKADGVKTVSVYGSEGMVVIAGNAVREWNFLTELPGDEAIRSGAGMQSTGNAASNPLAINHGLHKENIAAFVRWLNGEGEFELDLIGAGMAPIVADLICKSNGASLSPPSLVELAARLKAK